VGLPGDEVLVTGGELYLNGQRVDEPYAPIRPDYAYPPDGRPVRVPSSSYFVLGDNRRNSIDSHRGWFVPEATLEGLVLARFWPVEQAAPIPRSGT
jgi:signal peptidase I